MNTDPADENSIVKDGLSGSSQPLPRELDLEAASDTGMENDSAPDASNNTAARADVEGLNKAVGPAEASNDHAEDGRALTTDISPTD